MLGRRRNLLSFSETMIDKRIPFLVLLSLALCIPTARAQEDIEKEFEKFRQQQLQDFNDFRSKADAEYEAFLRQAWEKYEGFAPEPAPVRPEPPEPVTYEPTPTPPAPLDITPAGIKQPTTTPYAPTPRPVPPMKPAERATPRTEFTFYGQTLELASGVAEGLTLAGVDEAHVADAWKALCTADHATFVDDCLRAKQKHHMNDWMYLMLTKEIGLELYGATDTDRIAFLQMFILVKSGYKVRLARVDGRLKLLLPSPSIIYAMPYITMDGTRYYVLDPEPNSSLSIYTYKNNFADASNLVAIDLLELPEFDLAEQPRTLRPQSGAFEVNTTVNKNLIDFYHDYPQCEVAVHFHTPMSTELKESLYPTLRTAIEGKSETEATNILLHFVQTAFEYKTDGDQFGYDKPNFLEETFYYPYCDCEDRAMLFATLVRDLVGLETVLLDYPGHIAAAVKFPDSVKGDRIVLDDGTSYLICDPTYIGAPIGMCMDDYRTVGPGVIF